ncbi:trypsin-like serine protease [Psychromonas sp. MME1]|uniref:trypsin-like serine protease n=1 Tax=Psychromonas sp. MME1 TaxID=3231032 RepID=UPI0034E1D682
MILFTFLFSLFTTNAGATGSDLMPIEDKQMLAKIVGGQQASPGEFPFMVSLQNGGYHLCGGSVVSRYYILTAAHCVAYLDSAVMGLYNKNDTNGTQRLTIVEKIPHPNYATDSSYDIALVKTNLPIDSIYPSVSFGSANTGSMATVTGWGAIYHGGPASDILLKVDVPIASSSVCNATENMLCAGYAAGGKDSCQGDSGGPLFTGNGTQIGIVSHGNGCADPGQYGYYTRVSTFTSWINQYTGSAQPINYTLTVNGGSGSNSYAVGTNVTINANAAPAGQVFDHWVVTNGNPQIANNSGSTTTLTMPATSVTVTATYKEVGSSNYYLTVNNGSGSASYAAGTNVTINANTAPAGQAFDHWVVTNGNPQIANSSGSTTTLTMPATSVTITATYKEVGSSNYYLTVNSGSGSASYTVGESVLITAHMAPYGQEFDRWVVNSGNTQITNINQFSTFITMPASAVEVTAMYKALKNLTLKVNNGSGSGTYLSGTTLTVTANTAPAGKIFDKWVVNAGDPWNLDLTASTSYLMMQSLPVTITATYKPISEPTYRLTVQNGGLNGDYKVGDVVTIQANQSPYGKVFDRWFVLSGDPLITSRTDEITTLTMPAHAVTLSSTYKNKPLYTLKVIGGSGSGNYPSGTPVAIDANPAYDQYFVEWLVKSGTPTIDSLLSESTTLIMPANDVALAAQFDGGDDSINTQEYQAEDYTSRWNVSSGTGAFGYTGTAFMDYGGNESYLEWNNIYVSNSGDYQLDFRYAAGSSRRPSKVIHNGNTIGTLNFARTANWSTWNTESIVVPLVSGYNTIRVVAGGNGGPNLDKMSFIESEQPENILSTTVPSNLALGRETSQSSTYGVSAISDRAVDGNTSGIWGDYSTTRTGNDMNAWWKVELGGARKVNKVTLWNSTEEAYLQFLTDFNVDLLDVDNNVIATKHYPGTAGSKTDIDVSGIGVHAVRVQKNRQGYLCLAEVEVIGTDLINGIGYEEGYDPTDSDDNIALYRNTSQSSTYADALSSYVVDGNTDGRWGYVSLGHTNSEANAWWKVTLDGASTVNKVVIWNNTDVDPDQLTDFHVDLLDVKGNVIVTRQHSGTAGVKTEFDLSASGVYAVRVQLNGTGALILAEVQVFVGDGTVSENNPGGGYDQTESNIALHKSTSQSSNYSNITASRAVDGNTDGNWSSASLTHTLNDHQAWWKVDLGGAHQVNRVVLWNRTDCCSNRLSNFHVDLLDIDGNVLASEEHPGMAITKTEINIYSDDVYTVRVQLNGQNYLSLAEVEVFGYANKITDFNDADYSLADEAGSASSLANNAETATENSAGGATEYLLLLLTLLFFRMKFKV